MRHDTTLLAARILGPLLVIGGIMLITQPHRMLTALGSFILNDAMLMTAGFISLLLGLSLVTFHQRWDTITGGIITVLGYIITARGVLVLLAPNLVSDAADIVVRQPNIMPIAGCVMALLGVWFTYTGYISGTLRVDPGR